MLREVRLLEDGRNWVFDHLRGKKPPTEHACLKAARDLAEVDDDVPFIFEGMQEIRDSLARKVI